jgi:hypothetical protein
MKEYKEILFENLDDEYSTILKKYYTLNELSQFKLKIKDNIIYIKNKNEYIYFDKNIQYPENTKFKIDWRNIDVQLKILPKYEKILKYYYNLNQIDYQVKKNKIEIMFKDKEQKECIYFDEIIKNDNNKYYNIIYQNIKEKKDNIFLIQVGNYNTLEKMYHYLDILNEVNQNYLIALVENQINDKKINILKQKLKNLVIIEVKNKGMDIGIFLVSLLYLREHDLNYKYLVKIHTKTDDRFREHVCDHLIGSKKCIENNFFKMDNNSSIGMLNGTLIFNFHKNNSFYNNHMKYLYYLTETIFNEKLDIDKLEFAVGTFFYSRFDVFDILDINHIKLIYNQLNDFESLDINWYSIFYNLKDKNDDYIIEHWKDHKAKNFGNNLELQYKTDCQGMRDFMLEHALERFFGYLNKNKNYTMVEV